MKPRRKRSSGTNDTFLEKSQAKTGGTASKKKETFNSFSGEGVQCEMGNEVFRRFWTPPNCGEDENDIGQVITGDPIGSIPVRWNTEDQGKTACSIKENPTIESTDKVNSSSSSNWTNAVSSQQVIVDGSSNHSTTTCEVPAVPDLSVANNEGNTVIFPMVLNVVDGSGTKEVVAVLSLDPMPPIDNSITLGETEENSSTSMEGIASQQETNMTKTYTCGDCQKVFINILPYEKHCLEHSSSEPFKCTRCTRRFKRRQDLDRHIVCHPEEAFTCGTCFMKFSDRDELVFHYKSHESGSPSPKSSEDHEKTDVVYDVEKFQCSQCDKTFSDADLLQHHEFTHSEGELYPCDQCGRTFREERRLGMHLKLHKKNQRCDKCDEIFTNMFDFNEHMIAHKYEDCKEEYKCVHCKLSFSSFYFLKKHVSSHGMEVHWCGDCGGSGHVGPHGQHEAGGTHSTGENPVVLFVKSDNPLEEDDPLKLEDNSGDALITGDIEEQLEIEVQVEDVVIKHEKCSSSEGEADMSNVVNTKGKKKRQKRKPTERTPSKNSQERRQKSARHN